jgi:hypothetical protein
MAQTTSDLTEWLQFYTAHLYIYANRLRAHTLRYLNVRSHSRRRTTGELPRRIVQIEKLAQIRYSVAFSYREDEFSNLPYYLSKDCSFSLHLFSFGRNVVS